ncbi:MAG: DNA mismatch repair endonuclease MutL [Bacteroidales bacterium]|jgi:DNA mismatch repair protein MutL|nr:DNA mismatch repair endonuclease MutL [Bacteroidales bacterium]MBQ2397909.1 DNA mismatch repair endonuclease MutL [Bacteroidales bacterium]MBQ5891772.1 DNA mismatch repair endonuclease MutL [Bacteroidales bacterium]
MAIEVLSEIVANQIAAGEVVNRPASVVKELLENSIDSGADEILLIIKDAGRTLIQVKDNGCGMSREDAEKCFLAHATSKIRTSEDLLNLCTMGFRGEALSSIAAISQIELQTRRQEDELGTRVIIEGGVVKEVSEISCPKGTNIFVKNIFFNTPARRNFLKSDSVEFGHINEEFIRVALVNTNVNFSLYHNEQLQYRLEVGNQKRRIIDIFGSNLKEKLLPIEENIEVVKIKGFVCKAELCKKTKNQQYFFVNGRFMKNNYFANAIERAYSNLIAEKTYPIFFIELEVNPKNIDVNIHPTKTEVKFLDDKLIYAILHAATKRSIGQFSLSNELDFTAKPIEIPVVTKSSSIPNAPVVNFNSSFNPFESKPQIKAYNEVEQVVLPLNLTETQTPNKTIVFQLANKYIVSQSKDSFTFIDQSRASERIIYEKILSNNTTTIESQRLLTPYPHNFSPQVNCQIKEFTPILRQYGIEIEYDEVEKQFLILSKPLSQNIDECIDFIEELICSPYQEEGLVEKQEDKAMRLSKKLRLKYGEKLSDYQMQTLLSQLFCLPNCQTTADGKKIIHKLTIQDIENKF